MVGIQGGLIPVDLKEMHAVGIILGLDDREQEASWFVAVGPLSIP
jgi:hypothetical protein